MNPATAHWWAGHHRHEHHQHGHGHGHGRRHGSTGLSPLASRLSPPCRLSSLVSTVLPPTPPLTSACDAPPGLPWTCFPSAAGLDMGNFNLDTYYVCTFARTAPQPLDGGPWWRTHASPSTHAIHLQGSRRGSSQAATRLSSQSVMMHSRCMCSVLRISCMWSASRCGPHGRMPPGCC